MSDFEQWAKDGRLATIALVVVFITWLGFQVFADAVDRPSIMEQMLWTTMSGWLTNIAFVLARKDDNKPPDKKDG